MFKKIVSVFLITAVFSANIAFAEAIRIDGRNKEAVREIENSKTVFADDFTKYQLDTLPPGYRMFNGHAGTVKVAEYDVTLDNGSVIRKKCLEIDDNVASSTGSDKFAGPGFNLSFKEIKGKYACEVRMMFIEESNSYISMGFHTMGGGKSLSRLSTGSATGVTGTISSVGDTASVGTMEPGKWYTFRFIVDLESDLYQMKVTSKEAGIDKIYTELGLSEEASLAIESVNGIKCDVSVYDGKIILDYIKVEKSPVFYDTSKIAFVHPDNKIEPPVAESPVNRPLENAVNLCFKGEYLYPATPLYIENGKTMIYIKNFAMLFGGEYTSEGKLIINGKEIIFENDSDIAAVDGEKLKAEAKAKIKDGKLFIPLRFAAVTAGYTVGWANETKAVLIN